MACGANVWFDAFPVQARPRGIPPSRQKMWFFHNHSLEVVKVFRKWWPARLGMQRAANWRKKALTLDWPRVLERGTFSMAGLFVAVSRKCLTSTGKTAEALHCRESFEAFLTTTSTNGSLNYKMI